MPTIFSEDFSSFTGTGFASTPGAGQLDSDNWIVTGMSDSPNPVFGFSASTGDFARGIVGTSNPTTGGVYSSNAASNPTGSGALILQSGSADVDPGSITLRVQNTTGAALTDLHVSFDWLFRNNEGRGATLSFSYSTDGTNFTTFSGAGASSPTVAGSPVPTTFTVTPEHDLTLSGVTVGTDSSLYLRWNHVSVAGVSGASRDEVGIDNVSISTTSGGSPPPPPPAGTVSVTDVTQAEGNGDHVLAVTVTRTDTTSAFTVGYATHDGTATTADHDYDAASGALTFAAGGPATQTINVTVHGDATVEPNETFSVTLATPVNTTGSTVVGTATSTVTLTNDDVVSPPPPPPPINGPVFINEFHYDNSGTDTGEFVEVAAPTGVDLTGYKLEFYNGNGGALYDTKPLSGVVADVHNGEGVISVSAVGIQNGGTDAAPQADGIALVDPQGHVVEFISYEGVMTATSGAAAGMTSTDVGVAEDGSVSGSSIARTGPGAEGSDFTWTLSTDDTPGTLNGGETFLAPSPRIHISDPTIIEGDSGTSELTFTVTRTGTTDAFAVNYATADGTATSGSDYAPVSGTLNFAVGQNSQTVTVLVNGDAVSEGNETFRLNLTAPTNGAVLIDAQGTGTITNNDISVTKIYDIQGAAHASPFNGTSVLTEGVVTAIDTTGAKGFWIQDQTGDGNAATSDAVFVFTNSDVTSAVHVGDLVDVSGTVNEFSGVDPNNLPITEIDSDLSKIAVVGTGHIDPLIIGAGGVLPPTEVIDNDHFGTFDPSQDAVDFYESIEGMLVTVTNSQATDSTFFNTAGAGSTWIVADNGAEATGMDSRGSITIGANDLNPERIQIFADSGVSNLNPSYVVGDHPGNVTGVVSYFGGNYELIPTAIQNTTGSAPATVPRESTMLTGDANHVTIGSYNLENLDPTDPQSKFDALGSDIAHNLGAPDIIGVEEIQDADGSGLGSNLSGTATLDKLIASISAAGGPHYSYVEIDPSTAGQTGGEPGGNIRQAFLYNADRVQFVNGSLHNISDDDPTNGDAYNNSRMPLVANFSFNGQTITAVDVHNYSRGGSDEPFGLDQPAINSGDQRRIDQTSPVEHFVQQLEAADPTAHVAVMGDFNAFPFETTLTQLTTGGILQNLSDLLPANEVFSYIFEGNAQLIDNMLVSPTLQSGAQFDVVHVNSGLPDTFRPTDHDPIVSRLFVDTKPVAVADNATVADDATVNIDVTANDIDADAGDTKTLVSVSSTALGGHVSVVGGVAAYTADADSFDLIAVGQHVTDSFSYVMRDAQGLTSTSTVTVTVNGIPTGPTQTGDAGDNNLVGTNSSEKLDGGAGNDTLSAGGGADTVAGGLGNDMMLGGSGSDSLSASDGTDTLVGGDGNDVLSGNRGNDLFVFGAGFGHDIIIDYQAGDRVQFQPGTGFASFSDVASHMAQSGINVIITDAAGDTLQINSTTIATLTSHSGDFLFA
jgi:predicted extracellular nuclease